MTDPATILVQAAQTVGSQVASGAVAAAVSGAAVYAVTQGVRWVVSAVPHPGTGLRMVEGDRPAAFGRRWQLLQRIEGEADRRGDEGRSLRAGMLKTRLRDRTETFSGVRTQARRMRREVVMR